MPAISKEDTKQLLIMFEKKTLKMPLRNGDDLIDALMNCNIYYECVYAQREFGVTCGQS